MSLLIKRYFENTITFAMSTVNATANFFYVTILKIARKAVCLNKTGNVITKPFWNNVASYVVPVSVEFFNVD